MMRLTISVFAFVMMAASAMAVTIDITPSKDNTLYESQPGALSNGQGQWFFAGLNAGSDLRRGLVEFDVSGIPAGSVINSAQLHLYMDRGGDGTPQTVNLHRLTREWGEGGSVAGGNEGGGALALVGDATWAHTFSTTQFWTGLGAAGDFAAVATSSAVLSALELTYTWTGLEGDVQAWVNDAGTNHGWIVINNEAASSTSMRFASVQNANPLLRPLLHIEFTPVPEPGAAVLLAFGASIILRRRRSI